MANEHNQSGTSIEVLIQSDKDYIRSKMLLEYQSDIQHWYYVTLKLCSTKELVHSIYIKAHGQFDACYRIQNLGFWYKDCETLAIGPIDVEFMETYVPNDLRWRIIPREEAVSTKLDITREEV